MSDHNSSSTDDATPWTIRDAKACLSELLRKVKEQGPQRIGSKGDYVVITHAEWRRLTQPRAPMGDWLLNNLAGYGPLELPERKAGDGRAIPFAESP